MLHPIFIYLSLLFVALNICYIIFLRKSSTMKVNPFVVMNNEPDAKRKKTDYGQASAEKSKNETGKMIELEIFGSDEDI